MFVLKAKILMWLAQWGMILDGIVGVGFRYILDVK